MAIVNTNMASEFWFFSQLNRLGYESYITLGNTKKIDIIVILKNNNQITFDVKGKASFNSGAYQYLPLTTIKNHFFVFVGLQVKANKINKKVLDIGNIECYIVESTNLKRIAMSWKSKKVNNGYGFDPKLLPCLKQANPKLVSKKTFVDFKTAHNITGNINFRKYSNIIMTLEDFENKYYNYK